MQTNSKEAMIPSLKRAISVLVGIPWQLELIREAVVSHDPQGWREQARNCRAWHGECESLRRELGEVRSSRDEYQRLWRNEENARIALRNELATEREAHQIAKEDIATEREAHRQHVVILKIVNHELDRLQGALGEDTTDKAVAKLGELKQQLASALDKLDKLTRWRNQGQESCPFSDNTPVDAKYPGATQSCGTCPANTLQIDDQWRHNAESLQALQESEGGKCSKCGAVHVGPSDICDDCYEAMESESESD